jgi:hypothetical protein
VSCGLVSRHTRSVEALARREERYKQKVLASKFVFDNCFRDRERAEQICLVTKEQIADHLEGLCGHSETEYTQHERGEVVTDSKGFGSFQK